MVQDVRIWPRWLAVLFVLAASASVWAGLILAIGRLLGL